MSPTTPRLLALGDCAWTVELGAAIDPEINARCQDLARAIRAWAHDGGQAGISDVVPTFRSVTVFFDPEQLDGMALGHSLGTLAETAQARLTGGRQWRFPVYFGGEHAADLALVAAQASCSTDEVIALMTQARLQVFAMGFMPGFPYLAPVPAPLGLPRRATPRTAVPARSLAIANGMACVYPWQSPGGWHLLGQMPIGLFDLREAQAPALLKAGDSVQFYAVDAAELDALNQAQQNDARFRWRFLQDAADAGHRL